jgi:uncharacterized protein DUF2867
MGGSDYRDIFEVPLTASDDRSAKELYLAGIASMPTWLALVVLVAHRYLLRLRLAPASAPRHLMGWQIMDSDHDSLRLGAAGPLIDSVLVARRTGSTAVLETSLTYRRSVLGRLVWAVVGPVHRKVGPYLLRRATASAER